MSPVGDERLQTLLDKQAIAEQLAAYCRGVDRIDLDLIRSVFHPGAVADYGEMFHGTGEEFADFIGQVHPAMQTHSHHVSTISVTIDGDEAGSECYVITRLRSVTDDGGAIDTVAHGRYVDLWRRDADAWRITHRRYLHALDETRPIEGAMFSPGGARDRTDPSYRVLMNRGSSWQP